MARVLNDFDTKLVSAEIFTALDQDLVWGQPAVTSRQHEGHIRGIGSTVKVITIADTIIRDYDPNSTIAAPDTIADESIELVVDQAKYFNRSVDDADSVFGGQSVLSVAASRAGRQLGEIFDAHLAKTAALGAGIKGGTLGTTATPLALTTGQDAYKFLIAMRTRMTRGKVPKADRWVMLTPEVVALLLSESRLVNYNQLAIYTGEVGAVAGFRIIETNVAPETAGVQSIVAGVPGALAAAAAIDKVEAFRPQTSFSDAIKGLHLYGAKVVRPTLVGVGLVTVAA